jgi:MFS transporter, AAHS family, 4-hydroxybenzoate transporter
MQAETLAVAAEQPERLHLRVAWLCGVVLFLEGYDIAAVGYAIPSLVDAWRVAPSAFTQVLTAGNIGLLLGSLGVGLLGDQLGRKPVLLCCVAAFGVFSLLSAFADSLLQMASLRFLTGLGLGGGIPLAIALASDFAPPMGQGRLVILMSVGVPIGFTVGGGAGKPACAGFRVVGDLRGGRCAAARDDAGARAMAARVDCTKRSDAPAQSGRGALS